MDCIFIGYALNSSAYKFLLHESEILDTHVNMIIESKDVVFFEDIFSYKQDEENFWEKNTRDSVQGRKPQWTNW